MLGNILKNLFRRGHIERFAYVGAPNQPSSAQMKAPSTYTKKPCPLCNTALVDNQRVKSDVTPAITLKGVNSRLMRIFGCPYCLPKAGGLKPRYCPVCKKEIKGDEGHLIARYYEHESKRNHIHVIGCSNCIGDK